MKRRAFNKISLLGAFAPLVKQLSAFGSEEDPTVNKPVVISTWNHGIPANEEAWKTLAQGGNALDAVEAGVRIIESDKENRSVGIGGRPDSNGEVTLDACIMDHNSHCGSVGYLKEIENPISVARKVMEETPHVMLVCEGALSFATSQGFKRTNLLTPETEKDWLEWKKNQEAERPQINHENHDTIGMLALDEYGNLSGACTTSGWAYKHPGRLGDSPIIGAGLFVDNEVGAACATGMGEAVIRIAGSTVVVELMRQGNSPEQACKLAVERILAKHKNRENLQVGFLALNREGHSGGYSVYSGFNYAIKTQNQEELVDTGYFLDW